MTATAKKPATKTTPPTPPRQTTIRSDMIDKLWRAKHSPWKTATLAATLAAIATPIIEYAATRTITLNAAPLLGYAVAPTIATLDPHSRKKAKTDLRNAPTSARTRRAWKQWTNTPEGAAVTYGASFTREMLTGQKRRAPRIIRVTRDPDAITIEAPSFLTQNQWDALAEPIGRALNRKPPTITLDRDRKEATLTFRALGELNGGLRPWRADFPQPFPEDLESVPIGRDEDGQPVHAALLYSHQFIFGATGSGKGSAIWTILGALAPGIADGRVQLWGMDPKGGMELVLGQGVFTRLEDGNPDELRAMVSDFRDEVRARSSILKEERCRKFVPGPSRPYMVLIIDEYLSLITLQPNAKARAEVETMLLEILSKGRAIGFTVIGAAQLAQKEYLKALREMFPQQVCLRTTSKTQTIMSLEDAIEHEALAHKIPDDGKHQGIGYYKRGGSRPTLMRFAQWTDSDIEAMEAWVLKRGHPPAVSTANANDRVVVKTKPVRPQLAKPAAVTSPMRAAVETELDAGATDTTKIAAAAGCTTRYVRTIINERRKARTATAGGDDTPTTRTNQTHPEPVQEQALEPATQPLNETELHSGSAGRRVRNEVPGGDPTSVVKSPQVDALTSVFSDPPSLVQWGSQTEETDWVDVLGDRS